MQTKMPKQLPLISIDPTRLAEVLRNVVSNAIKYNRTGGTVSVQVDHSQNMITIGVTDTGIGIPKTEQKKIFGRFYRASNANETHSTGTGLGLFVAQSYVKDWGGTVSFVSELEKGSTFTITIPYNA